MCKTGGITVTTRHEVALAPQVSALLKLLATTPDMALPVGDMPPPSLRNKRMDDEGEEAAAQDINGEKI